MSAIVGLVSQNQLQLCISESVTKMHEQRLTCKLKSAKWQSLGCSGQLRRCSSTCYQHHKHSRYTAWLQKWPHPFYFWIIPWKSNQFNNFQYTTSGRSLTREIIHICPPHLQTVAALPWEVQKG